MSTKVGDNVDITDDGLSSDDILDSLNLEEYDLEDYN